MKKTLAALGLGLLAMASAHSAIVTIDFSGLNGQASYSEDGFNFTVTGNHTDGTGYMYFHDGGANPGNTDLVTVRSNGGSFSILSLDLLYSLGSSIVGSNGQTITLGDRFDFAPLTTQINLLNVTSVTFRTSSSGLVFDNLVLDTAPGAVPEPASLALVVGGLLAAGAARRRRNAA